MVLASCIIMGCHGWQVKLIGSSRVKEIEGNSSRLCCQGDRKILIYMKRNLQNYKNKKCEANFVDDFDPSKDNQIEHSHENDNIHLQMMYIWALQNFKDY